MTIIEAMKNALEFLEANGYKNGGDIHNDLQKAIWVLGHYKIANTDMDSMNIVKSKQSS